MPERIRGTSREIVESARELRRRQTPAEARFWEAVRNRDTFPHRIRRQHAIGTYIVDFWIARPRIVIELDGSIHDEDEIAGQDLARTEWLQAQDILVLRFSNADVFDDLESVLSEIDRRALIRGRRPPRKD
jgi:very-short-patch-repair endonuclease